ncbi:MAG TPA: DUF3455 domain-containing protein [Polyangiaceae bacterium]|nr:DUF3455 domain-containing protein [Polyangiaceae bacterium]
MKRSVALVLACLGPACASSPPAPANEPAPAVPAASVSAAPVAVDPPPAAPAPAAPATASAESKPAPPETPDAIKVPNPASVAYKGNAVGVQIYACGPSKESKKKFEWTLKAPDASLTDDAGKPFAKHYGGPTWEATDGSKVVGAMKAKVDAPDATAIPWLLVEAKSNEGQGVLANIGWVQRVQTVGGKAPSTGCDKAHDGAETRVDYRATYYFYAR